MSWAHRQGNPLPAIFREVEELVLDPESWRKVRSCAKKLRLAKARKDKAERQLKAEERRRTYMRAYMARRRRKERP